MANLKNKFSANEDSANKAANEDSAKLASCQLAVNKYQQISTNWPAIQHILGQQISTNFN